MKFLAKPLAEGTPGPEPLNKAALAEKTPKPEAVAEPVQAEETVAKLALDKAPSQAAESGIAKAAPAVEKVSKRPVAEGTPKPEADAAKSAQAENAIDPPLKAPGQQNHASDAQPAVEPAKITPPKTKASLEAKLTSVPGISI